jgi:hypothetical protein
MSPPFHHPGQSEEFTRALEEVQDRLKKHEEADRKRALLKLAVDVHVRKSTKEKFLEELARMFGPSLAQAIQDIHSSYLRQLLDNPATDPDLKAVLTAVLDTKED